MAEKNIRLTERESKHMTRKSVKRGLKEELSAGICREALSEMARIGFMTPELEIYVNTDDDGDIPHFHIRDYATKGNEFHTCIEIKRNLYFHHNGKESFLNGKLRKTLISFLYGKDEYGEPHWILIIKEWNRNNSGANIALDTPMPNYTTIMDN